MTDQLEPDLQYELAYAAPELDRVEAALRATGHETLADDLFKIQQDNGLDRVESVAASIGKDQTAALLENYEGNTAARTAHVLRECHAALNDAELKNWLAGFMQTLNMPVTASSPTPPRPAP